MAEVVNTHIVGDILVRPSYDTEDGSTEGRLTTLARYDKALGQAAHDTLHYMPAGTYSIDLYVLTTANNNTKASAAVRVPYPLTVWSIDVACETAAGTTGTVDVEVSDDGSSWTSLLDAAQDVKTTAGLPTRVAPEADSEDLAYNTYVRCAQTSGSAADMIGGQAHLLVQRQ